MHFYSDTTCGQKPGRGRNRSPEAEDIIKSGGVENLARRLNSFSPISRTLLHNARRNHRLSCHVVEIIITNI